MPLNDRSKARLTGVHPQLVGIVELAMQYMDASAQSSGGLVSFVVTEGVRSEAKQKELVKAGASQTMKSRHLTGHAVDLAATVNGTIRWDWPLYAKLNEVMQRAAKDVGVKLEWGGDWKTLKDGPHFQLPWADYP